MNLSFVSDSCGDYFYWHKNNKKVAIRINQLIKEIKKTPYRGLGKPKPLKHQLVGCWSRRIDHQNRLVYKIEKSSLIIISCRYHK